MWLRIEDAGYVDKDGYIWLVGRVKWRVVDTKNGKTYWSAIVEQKVIMIDLHVYLLILCSLVFILYCRYWIELARLLLLLISITKGELIYSLKHQMDCLSKKKKVWVDE